MCRHLLFFCFCLFCALTIKAQETTGYLWPINAHRITGTFGEMRGTHFHPGLDIGTNDSVGLPVYAAADGYVARVKTAGYGYGKAIYIQHPDGHSTVYCHLMHYMPSVDARIYALQLATKRFDQEIFLKSGEIPVHRGDTIGYSGLTGATDGAHLHFEVRDAQENILNPQPFLHQLVDTTPPQILHVALTPLDADALVRGEFATLLMDAQKPDTTPIAVSGKIGIGYDGWDTQPATNEGPASICGVYRSSLYLDDSLIFESRMDKFSFAEGGLVGIYGDYALKQETGIRLQKCFVEPGISLPMYTKGPGIIELTDTAVHKLTLVSADHAGNETKIIFRIRKGGNQQTLAYRGLIKYTPSAYALRRGVLVLQGPLPKDSASAFVTLSFSNGSKANYPITSTHGEIAYTLVPPDGRTPIKTEAGSWAKALVIPFIGYVKPGESKALIGPNGTKLGFLPGSLFNPTWVGMQTVGYGKLSAVYSVGNPSIPLKGAINLHIPLNVNTHYRPEQIVVAELAQGRYSRVDFNQHIGNDYAAASTHFGDYCLVADTLPPHITPLNFTPDGMVSGKTPFFKLQLSDDIAGIAPASVTAWLDGHWQLAEYYGYQDVCYLPLQQALTPGRHLLRIALSDYCGNSASKLYIVWAK